MSENYKNILKPKNQPKNQKPDFPEIKLNLINSARERIQEERNAQIIESARNTGGGRIF